MRRNPLSPLPALCVLLAATVAPAQKFAPKFIQFVGDSEYSTQELMAAAGLQKSAVLSRVVNYTVDVEPGPVYHMGLVKFDNVSDSLRSLLMHDWQMMHGDPFNESYVSMFNVKAQMQDPALRRSLAGAKASFNAIADPQTHDVNLVIRLSR